MRAEAQSRAAERAADYAYWQLYISGIGLGIVAVSLWFAGIGAFAARDAARAGIKQGEAIISAERPYVTIKITEPGIQFSGDGTFDFKPNNWFAFEFINHGKTPALLDEFYETYPVVTVPPPEPIDPMVARGRLLPTGTVSANGSPFLQDTNLIKKRGVDVFSTDKSAWRSKYLLFQGYIRYSDAFGNHYILGWLARFFPEHDAWVLRGDKRYNYSRQERPETYPRIQRK